MHYDGATWTEVSIERSPGELLSLWGSSQNDLWAGTNWPGHRQDIGHGTLYHYDGVGWKKVARDTPLSYLSIAGFGPSDAYMFSGRSLTGPDTVGIDEFYFNHWDGNSWTVVDSEYSQGPLRFGGSILALENHMLYSTGHGVNSYKPDGSWEKLLSSREGLNIFGSSNENIFAIGGLGSIYHWNGTDWKTIPSLVKGEFSCGWTNNMETFLVGDDGRATYVMHGK
jgi:hypothetical protein